MAATPDSPDTPAVATGAGRRRRATREAMSDQLRSLLADGYRVVVAAEGDGSATRLSRILGEHGLDLVVHASEPTDDG